MSGLHNTSDAKIGPFSRIYVDRAGHKMRTVTEPFDGALNGTSSLVVQDFTYNSQGILTTTTQPYFLDSGGSTVGSSSHGSTTTSYDILGRMVEVDVSDPQTGLAKTKYTYGLLTTTVTDDKNQVRTEERNVEGKVIRVTDNFGAQIAYQYDAFGNLLVTKDALQNQTVVTYDIRGRKTSMTDPDSGLWQYDYDALGELVWQQNATERATSQATVMTYDELGRLIQRVEPEYTSKWNYDTYTDGSACSYGIGKLCESSTSNGITSRKMVYDNKGRPSSQRTTISSGPSFATSLSYDGSSGRIATRTYPTGLTVGYAYTPKGFLSTLTLNTTATVGGSPCPGCTTLWQAQSYNAWGKVESELYGNNVVSKAKYEALTGRISSITAGVGSATNVQNYAFNWNSLNQLTGRTDQNGDGSGGAVSEIFLYDGIGRLKSYEVDAPTVPLLSRTVTLAYNALGSILTKSDVGGYSYPAQGAGSVRPHAVQGVIGASYSARFAYDANGNMVCSNGGATNCPVSNIGSLETIAYTSFNLPDGSTGLQGPGQAPVYKWLYDESHQRFKETRTSGGVTRTTYMLHPDNAGALSFESEQAGGLTTNRHYLTAGGAVVGVLVSNDALPTLGASQTAPTPLSGIALSKAEYWHKDHLGSLVATTDHNAVVTQRYAYDPFGKRRFTGGNDDASGSLVYDWSSAAGGTDRGFTGHEHLDDVGVIHMNGRTFDPRLGMFMQTDPMLQNPLNLQNYNRYGYCYNNPTNCMDPSGQDFGILEAVYVLAAVWGAHEANIINTQTARTLSSIVVAAYLGPDGGAFGGPNYGVGQAATAGFASGVVANGSFKGGMQGMFSAVAFYEAGQLIDGKYTDGGKLEYEEGVAVHGIVGCVTSSAGGGNCGSGALSASFSKAAAPYVNAWTQGDPSAMFVASAVTGGTGSVLGGGKFENGASTAAFGYLFKCLLHECLAQGRDAERTFVGFLGTSGATFSAGLEFNKWSDGAGNYFAGRPDIFSPSLNMLWDVKPDSVYGWASGPQQITRYMTASGYDAGTAEPLFGSRSSVVLQGAMNRYEFSLGAKGLVMYKALDASPMEVAVSRLLILFSAKRDAESGRAPVMLPVPVPLPIP